jgi:hypothetical protein
MKIQDDFRAFKGEFLFMNGIWLRYGIFPITKEIFDAFGLH